MSFDKMNVGLKKCSNTSQSLSSRAMSFDIERTRKNCSANSSQSLSSRAMSFDFVHFYLLLLLLVSIPFEQGDVFRLIYYHYYYGDSMSQSLSSRAMSFDCSGMLEAGIMRPFRPTSQFFWKVKELAIDLSK